MCLDARERVRAVPRPLRRLMCEACGTIKLLRFYAEQERMLETGELVICPWCRCRTRPLRVTGHVECENCHQVIEGCCEGDSLARSCEVSALPSSVSSAST